MVLWAPHEAPRLPRPPPHWLPSPRPPLWSPAPRDLIRPRETGRPRGARLKPEIGSCTADLGTHQA